MSEPNKIEFPVSPEHSGTAPHPVDVADFFEQLRRGEVSEQNSQTLRFLSQLYEQMTAIASKAMDEKNPTKLTANQVVDLIRNSVKPAERAMIEWKYELPTGSENP